ncbi:non-hydrolyzing UDP-N-acetylglucosamine 2-epimerase [Kitasatospora sp. LaBMicrA B282]|uniref:non-hydrolyzing UDP-N-acetylglucosamine 2-epimerase n=1 Tax=Kitasatospora sp. LaBMicrA B282 TaxID=3420949 RepID=UPI003D0E9B9B
MSETACASPGRDRGNSSFEGSIAFVLGTRPEIVKLAPVARQFPENARVAYTGQHYDPALSDVFFAECGMRRPDALLDVGGRSRGAQIGRATDALDALFARRRPAAVVVQGDTNATLAGALAANAHGIPLVHVEAGLRSFDRAMPEEHNRVMVDHLADLLCAATVGNVANLLAENIDAERIVQTGNTVVEAVHRHLPGPEKRTKLLADHGVESGRFVLATIHRPENTDDDTVLGTVLGELARIADAGRPVLFPMHPRCRAAAQRAGHAELLARLLVTDPVGYGDFLALAAESALIVSDSGGVQEEVTVLARPLVVVRRSTERPEALAHFATLVEPGPEIGHTARALLADVETVRTQLAGRPSPFGTDQAGALIAAATRAMLTDRA